MSAFRIALLLILSCLPAVAQEQTMDVGRGVICDTPQQAERFATLRAGGKDALVALQVVNDELKGAGACNFSLVMFTGGAPIATLSVNRRPASVVEITVHAFGYGSAWKQVPAIVRYTVAVEKGLIA